MKDPRVIKAETFYKALSLFLKVLNVDQTNLMLARVLSQAVHLNLSSIFALIIMCQQSTCSMRVYISMILCI